MRRIALGLVLVALGAGAPARGACPTGTTQVLWPTMNPVWDFCFARLATSSLPNGEGLTLRQVKYKGVLILERASIPILNVFYKNGCGPCLRDWFYEERAFDCAPTVAAGQCSGTTTPATTVCQHPGTDAGSFFGVAVEDKGTHLTLTAQAQAGWYRYVPVWDFWPDGTLEARVDATAVSNSCVQYTHDHHAYWRLDFDLGSSAGNFVDDLTAQAGSQRVSTEKSFVDSPAGPMRRWRVGSSGTAYTVDVIRNDTDGAAGSPLPFAGDNPGADGWLLAYNANQLTDNTSGCATNLNAFVNNENVDGADIALWVHGGALHEGELGGIPHECHVFGPTIKVRDPSNQPASFHAVAPCRVLDTRDAVGPFGGPALTAGADRSFILTGRCNVPATARVVSVNLTATQPTGSGYIQVSAVGGPAPPTSVLSFSSGQTRANNAFVDMDPSGAAFVRPVMPAGSVHVVLDVNGYFE